MKIPTVPDLGLRSQRLHEGRCGAAVQERGQTPQVSHTSSQECFSRQHLITPAACTVTVCSVAVSTIGWGVALQLLGCETVAVSCNENPVTLKGQERTAIPPSMSLIFRI